MQLSSIVGVPLFMLIGSSTGMTADELQVKSAAYWIVFSFFVALSLILFLMRKDMKEKMDRSTPASIPTSILWAVAGVFLALFAQSIAGYIEQMLGVEPESENTQQLISLIYQVPIVIFVTSVIGPILEEIIFRKIIFGSFINALTSLFLLYSVQLFLAWRMVNWNIFFYIRQWVLPLLFFMRKRAASSFP